MLVVDPVTGRPTIVSDEDSEDSHGDRGRYHDQHHDQHHDRNQQKQQALAQNNQVTPVPTSPVREPEPDPIVPTHGHELKGCFRVTGHDKVPEYRIYFNGRQTINNCEGFFSFPIDRKEVDNVSLVICKGFKHNVEQKNTIKNVSIIPNKDYQYFTYNRRTWVRCDQRFNHENFVIPENCVVILMDPQYIERVNEWNVQLGQRFTTLPIIVLKGQTHTDLKHESAKSLLSSLDAKIFHEPVAEVKKIAPNNPKIHMSLIQ